MYSTVAGIGSSVGSYEIRCRGIRTVGVVRIHRESTVDLGEGCQHLGHGIRGGSRGERGGEGGRVPVPVLGLRRGDGPLPAAAPTTTAGGWSSPRTTRASSSTRVTAARSSAPPGLTWGGSGFSDRQIDEYSLAAFLDELPHEHIAVGERVMVSPHLRGTGLIDELMERRHQAALEHDVRIQFAACEPHLLSLYLGQGRRTYATKNINTPEAGYLIPLVVFPEGPEALTGVGVRTAAGELPDCVDADPHRWRRCGDEPAHDRRGRLHAAPAVGHARDREPGHLGVPRLHRRRGGALPGAQQRDRVRQGRPRAEEGRRRAQHLRGPRRHARSARRRQGRRRDPHRRGVRRDGVPARASAHARRRRRERLRARPQPEREHAAQDGGRGLRRRRQAPVQRLARCSACGSSKRADGLLLVTSWRRSRPRRWCRSSLAPLPTTR